MTSTLHLLSLLGGLVAVLTLATVAGRTLANAGRATIPADVVVDVNRRINSWWVMVGLLGLGFLLGETGVTLLFALLSFAALREFLSLTDTRRRDHWVLLSAFFVVLPVQYFLVWQGWLVFAALFIPIAVFLALPIVSALQGDTTGYLGRIATTQWAVTLCIYCLSYVPMLMNLDLQGYDQRHLLLVAFFLVVVQASDVFQFVWGKLVGRHKIAPALSPSKTVEGLAGGVLSAAALGAALWWVTPFDPVEAAAMALVIAIMGFLGGLVMSAIKRDRGVKDWGNMIAGHGGVLDRLDSVVFSAPAFFLILQYGWTL
ncbi:MAG: phosphatidate cytidylyltransferase [Pseudomonadota bacterium]